jgi:hypothetical protein
MGFTSFSSMAVSATLHCLAGCALGEIAGLIAGMAFGLSTFTTIVISIALAFLFGYSLSIMPLLRNSWPLKTALLTVLAADSLSIFTMEVVDNAVITWMPSAMQAGLIDPLFWSSMILSLIAAFCAAVPVNNYLLERGKGHALVHKHH